MIMIDNDFYALFGNTHVYTSYFYIPPALLLFFLVFLAFYF